MRQIDLRPVSRTRLRLALGKGYYSCLRYVLWLKKRTAFAHDFSSEKLPFVHFSHETVLLRQLRGLDMQYQYNKIVNLRLASGKLKGVVIHPGELFSFWKLIGRPTKGKGYLSGMVLTEGKILPGVGGGLCQLSNLIYWMALHSPLIVVERHHHGYDVFPDNNRTQPFGSGATCFYPYGDLMLYNPTDSDFQLVVRVGQTCLEGELRGSDAPEFRYKIIEKNHEMRSEYWGGFSRHNRLCRVITDMDGILLREECIAENHVVMMYSPFLPEGSEEKRTDEPV